MFPNEHGNVNSGSILFNCNTIEEIKFLPEKPIKFQHRCLKSVFNSTHFHLKVVNFSLVQQKNEGTGKQEGSVNF